MAQFVFYFFKLPNELYNDIVKSGEKNLAISSIESTELLPTIARLIDNVVSRKEEKEAQGLASAYEEVLQEIDFKDDIAHAQDAISSMNKVELDYVEIVKLASWAWKIAALHMLTFIFTVLLYLFVPAGTLKNAVFLALGFVAALTLVRTAEGLFKLDKKRNALMATLNEYHLE